MGLRATLRRNSRELPLRIVSLCARARGAASARETYHVVVPFRAYKVYREQALTLADCLRALGKRAIVHPVGRFEQVGTLRPGDRVIAFAPYRLRALKRVPGVLYAAVNAEYYGDSADAGMQLRAKPFSDACDLHLECCEPTFAEAKRVGLEPDAVLPFAYGPRWDWSAAPLRPRYEVAYLGRFSPHRLLLWESIRQHFHACPRNEAWGRERPRFLRSAKIQLSFAQSERPHFPGHRFALALANGCFVLSEPLAPGAPFVPGEHYAEATAQDFVEKIAWFLEHPEERQRIAQQGRRFIREHYRLEPFVAHIVELMDARAFREGARAD